MTAVTKLIEMMQGHNVRQFNRNRAGQRIAGLDPYDLYYGYDLSGRVFVNVPIWAKCRHEIAVESVITVHQLYTNRMDVLGINTDVDGIAPFQFLGNRLDDLCALEKLLRGDEQRFYRRGYAGGNFDYEDLTKWVEFKLNHDKTEAVEEKIQVLGSVSV